MNKMLRWTNQSFLYMIPVIVVAWTLYLYFYLGPFYLRNIDPEYIYLISGLNCATLEFNKIGHIDHPGTPLQLLTGLFFRIIHLFTGHHDIVNDVISSPEMYLSLSSLMLAGITFFLLLRLGMLVYRYTSGILGALVLQASYFYTEVGTGILSRYSPDRLMTVILLLFFIIYIRYLYEQKFHAARFSLLCGILMGAGIVTKLNFAPLLILPLILIPGWRNRGIYTLSATASVILFFLPASSKYQAVWRIVKETFLHSGLYGSGEQEIIDKSSFFSNIALVFKHNPSFTIITILAGLCILTLVFWPRFRSINRKEFLFLVASLITIFFGLALTAKHYKGYYVLPVLSLIPLIFYTIIRLFEKAVPFRYKTLPLIMLFGLLLLFPLISTAGNFFRTNTSLHEKRVTASYIREQVSSEDYFLITPIWMANPMPENAMVLGVSYFHHRHRSYLEFERIYPRILTWEGDENPLMHMRMRVANFEEVLLSGKGIYIYSKPGWNSHEVCSYVERFARKAGIRVVRDTVYSYQKIEENVIRYSNIDGWKRTVDLVCGFEKQYHGQIYSDDERVVLTGDFVIEEKISAHGKHSLVLGQDMPRSPVYTLESIRKGDVISASVKASISGEDSMGNILIKCVFTDISGNTVIITSDPSPGKIDEDWYMSDLFAKIGSSPAESTIGCYVEYTGDGSVRLDDFTLEVYSRNSV